MDEIDQFLLSKGWMKESDYMYYRIAALLKYYSNCSPNEKLLINIDDFLMYRGYKKSFVKGHHHLYSEMENILKDWDLKIKNK